MKKKITLYLTGLALVVLFLTMNAFSAFAGSTFSISTVRPDVPGVQRFQITNTGADTDTFYWSADVGSGSLTLGPGASGTFDIGTSSYITVLVVNSDNSAIQSIASLNEYTFNVYANYGGSRQHLATAVMPNTGSASYTVEQYATIGGQLYECANTTQYLYDGGTEIVFDYTAVQSPDVYVDIYFVDNNGNQLGSDSFSVSYGNSVSYTAPSEISYNNKTYTLVSGQSATIDHNYNSTRTSYAFTYETEAVTTNKPYSVSIKLADASTGNTVETRSMSIPANGSNTFNLPTTFVSGTSSYALASGQPTSITHNSADSTRSYTVYYDVTSTNSPYDISIKLVDAATGATLDTITSTVSPEQVVNYTAESNITVGSSSYTLASGSGSISHTYGGSTRSYTIYYNNNTTSSSTAYTITVQYIDITTNTSFYTRPYTVNPGQSVTFSVPSSYTSSGIQYSLVSGQSRSTTHSFDNTRRNYNIYYRNSSLALPEDENVYVGETVYIDADGETIPITVFYNVSEEGEPTIVSAVDENGDLVEIEDENIPLAGLTGTEAETTEEETTKKETTTEALEDIEGGDVPLAGSAKDETTEEETLEAAETAEVEEASVTNSQKGFLEGINPVAAGIVIALIVAAGIIVVYVRKKKSQGAE